MIRTFHDINTLLIIWHFLCNGYNMTIILCTCSLCTYCFSRLSLRKLLRLVHAFYMPCMLQFPSYILTTKSRLVTA